MILDLSKRYSEPHRVYHVLTHPANMVEMGTRFFKLTDEQILAIWYHDVIYVPGSPTNEAESAEYFGEQFKNAIDIDVTKVKQIILDTKTHVPTIEESALVLDLDLMGLGAPWLTYTKAATNVRKEYAAFSDPEWQAGRKKFLESMGKRKQIFYTEYFIDNYEYNARENMLCELLYLRSHVMRYY